MAEKVFSPDGQFYATTDGTRCVYTYRKHTMRDEWITHNAFFSTDSYDVDSISWSPDGKYLVVIRTDMSLSVYSAGTTVRIFTMPREGSAASTCWTSNNDLQVTGVDGKVETFGVYY